MFSASQGIPVPAHYGDPEGEHRAALEGTAVVDRSHRARWAVTGRAPSEMMNGVLTCAMPAPLDPVGERVLGGRAHYGLALTPKGKIVSDLRVLPLRQESGDGLLLDVPRLGAAALEAHLVRYVPPRFARTEDRSRRLGMLTLLGAGAPVLLTREALGLRVDEGSLESMDDGELRLVGDTTEDGVTVVRTGEVGIPAWDVLADPGTLEALWRSLLGSGAVPAGQEAWSTLRIEAGRPAFGVDMGEDTLPQEAGLAERAIDHGKGCYTGQEVVVRIRDRGRVNRHLRGLLLGEEPPPPPGTELFREGDESPVGTVTSSARSARFGRALGIGYVRREVEPPARLRLGGPGGPPVEVRSLEGGGYPAEPAV